MAKIKTIWGPTKTQRTAASIHWQFRGVRANGQLSLWRLTFYFDSRSFRTRHIRTTNDDRIEQLPGFARIEEPMSGRVTDMLRAKLKPEHIAEATRLAIEYRRRHGR